MEDSEIGRTGDIPVMSTVEDCMKSGVAGITVNAIIGDPITVKVSPTEILSIYPPKEIDHAVEQLKELRRRLYLADAERNQLKFALRRAQDSAEHIEEAVQEAEQRLLEMIAQKSEGAL